MSNRSSLYSLLLIAPLAWGALLLYTHFVAPATFSAFVVFFLLLIIALAGTLTPVTYFVGRNYFSRHYQVTMLQALRQATLLALVIAINLMLRALHSWNFFMGLIILAAAIVIEVLAMARK